MTNKLDESDIKKIIRLRDVEKLTYPVLSKRFGVTKNTVWLAYKRGKKWSKVV